MADIIKTTRTLRIESLFVDGDTRLIILKNPKDNLMASEILELNTFIQTNNILIGDKTGATFGRIQSAKKVTVTERTLDLTS